MQRVYPTRNVPLLAVTQALVFSAAPMVALIGGIVGAQLAPKRGLATLPVSLAVVGLALTTLPAALLMRRTGRRAGFLLAVALGVGTSLLAAYALHLENFALFCLATFLFGSINAFVQQFRFAAAESVPAQHSSRAISSVLVGGMVAGFLGPEIARRTQNLLPYGEFTASFIILAGMYVAAMGILLFLKDVPFQVNQAEGNNRPLKAIARQPRFYTAVIAGAAAYAVMSFIMTATPLQMHTISHFSLAATTLVIQSHIIAMYFPSLFTGILIEKLGLKRLMLVGILAMLLTVGIGVASREVLHYWWALVLLGVGWNFLFVGGTVLLTSSYWPAERHRAQGANDFTIFGIQAVASLSAGSVLFLTNWDMLLLMTFPVLIGIGILVLRLNGRHSPVPIDVTGD